MQGTKKKDGQLLSPEDIAHTCGLSRRAVYRAINRGELRAARLCNRLRVDPEELRRWIEAMAVVPVEAGPGRVSRATEPKPGGLRAHLSRS